MNKEELARGLVELWELYLRNSWPRSFQPTMTDFVEWLREYEKQQSEHDVKEARTQQYMDDWHKGGEAPSAKLNKLVVKPKIDVEAGVTSAPLGDTLEKATEAEIRKLYKQGHSAARVRHMLGLTHIPLSRIYSICNKR